MTRAEEKILEVIYLEQPAVAHALMYIQCFFDDCGLDRSEEKIQGSLANLIESGLVRVITPETSEEIHAQIQDVYGPLYEIPDYPYYSLTSTGGEFWLGERNCSRDHCGQEVLSRHTQYFSLTAKTAAKISESVRSRGSLRQQQVCLSRSNLSVSGYTVDVIETGNFSYTRPSPLEDYYEKLASTVAELFTTASCTAISSKSFIVLLELYGYLTSFPRLTAQADEGLYDDLEGEGLVDPICKSVYREQSAFVTEQRLPVFSFTRHPYVVTPNGEAMIHKVLQRHESLQDCLVASRTISDYSAYYFPTTESAEQFQSEETNISFVSWERIGKWCKRWWKVYPEGVRCFGISED